MKIIGRILLILIAVGLSNALSAQDNNMTVPVDEQIRYGKLDNGLTYYIRPNSEPEKRASFYLVQNVGSLLEEDNQNGLAHFLEHMAFNGTSHFPGKGIISSLEKHGVAFGYNINAYTFYYETVYNLSDIPVDQPGLLDTCLLVLNDWSDYLLLTEEEIDAERGVIVEEWRTRRTSAFRMQKKYMPVLLKGSKYPERDIIGDIEIIKNFDYQTLRDYYDRWYRTDLQAVVVVGDFDAVDMEKKVIDLFSKIPAVKNPRPLPDFEIPEHNETLYVLATDKEATQHSVDLYIKLKAVDPADKGSAYLREQYLITLFNSMIGTRINELLQKGIPPFVTGSINYSSFLRGYDVFSIGVASKPNEDVLAFEAIYKEAERLRRHGFTPGELERAKSNMLTQWDSYYKEKDKISNDSYAQSIQTHFLINEPIASVDYEYKHVKEVVPTITLEEISTRIKQWMTPENRVIVVQGPEAEDAVYLSKEQALSIMESINKSQIDPYVDNVSGKGLLSDDLAGSAIIKTKTLEQFGAEEWLLDNGVKVIYKHADFEKDNISLSAYSYGGTSLVDKAYIPDAEMMPGLSATYGVGDFDNVSLQKMLSGKNASVSFSLGQLTESISGSASPEDIETMFQLLYLKFEQPRFDVQSHDALISRYEAYLAQMNNNPQKVMQDSLSLILSDYHPRTRIMNNDYIKDVEYSEVERIYRERFNDADDFTFIIVGNIDAETLKPLVEKYIGSLSSKEGAELWIDRNIDAPEGQIEKSISMSLAVPKSTVVVSINNDLEFSPYNRQAMRIIKGILDLRYNETIREEEGGTYGVSTNISVSQFPKEKANAAIIFDCEPERSKSLKDIVYREIEKLYTEGPSEVDLGKTVNNLLKTREESKTHNSYWMSTLYSFYFSGIDYNNPANYEDIIKKFTTEDIRKVALAFFKDADIVDLTFEPAEQ